MCNLHCAESKERQEIKCQCLCPINWSCLLCKSVEVFNDFSHHHGDTETREAFISSRLSPPFFHSSASLWYPSMVSWLSSFTCNFSICSVFVVGTISGAVVQIAVSKQRNLLCFVARVQGKHQLVLLQQKWEMCRQHIPSFWGLLQSQCCRAPSELPVFAGESPRPAELLCSLQTALRSKVHQDL